MLIISCQSDEEIDTDLFILTIEVKNGAIPDGVRLFYSIKGESGEDIKSGELHNGRFFISDETYNGNKVAITFFTIWPFFQNTVQSYLDVPIGEVVTFNGRNASPSTTISRSIKFEGFTTDFKQISLSQNKNLKIIKPKSIIENESLSFDFDSNDPFTFLALIPTEGRWEYQTFDINEMTTIVGRTNLPMENEHAISIPDALEKTFKYNLGLRGFIGEASPMSNSYYINNEFYATFSSNILKFYTPSIFDNYALSLAVQTENTSFNQLTIGEIPNEFTFLDASFEVDSIFENQGIKVNSFDELTYTNSTWRYNNGLTPLIWSIYSPQSPEGGYLIHEIPESITTETDQLNSIDLLEISSVRAVKIDNTNYSEWVVPLLNSNKNFDSKIIEKRISF